MITSSDHEPVTMTEAEYLAYEEKSDTKHEYVGGTAHVLDGAGWNHNIINGNTHTSLNSQPAAKPCVVLSSDMRLKVVSSSISFRYPDTMVVCGAPEFVENRQDTITNPTVIIEVMSASTALEDRNAKLDEYTRLESLEEYFLISQSEVRVERFRRHESGEWLYTNVTDLKGHIAIVSIGCTLELRRIYDKVSWLETD